MRINALPPSAPSGPTLPDRAGGARPGAPAAAHGTEGAGEASETDGAGWRPSPLAPHAPASHEDDGPDHGPGHGDTGNGDLAALRAELDRIDDAMHDLLMARAAVVTRVAAAKRGGTPLRPGREAAILRRLLHRTTGPLPRQAVVRVWREIINAHSALQGGFVIAVCETDGQGGGAACAHEQFGALTPLRLHRTAAQAIGDVSAGRAAAAILPLPTEEEPQSAAWWTALLHRDDPRIHIVGRLPFWTPRPEGASKAAAFVVATVPPDPSGDDRSLLGLEVAADLSRNRLGTALAAAGFAAGTVILRRDAGSPVARALVDVAGLVAEDDPRLAALTEARLPPVVLGGYAVPLQGDAA